MTAYEMFCAEVIDLRTCRLLEAHFGKGYNPASFEVEALAALVEAGEVHGAGRKVKACLDRVVAFAKIGEAARDLWLALYRAKATIKAQLEAEEDRVYYLGDKLRELEDKPEPPEGSLEPTHDEVWEAYKEATAINKYHQALADEADKVENIIQGWSW